ncbi:TetR/AcrR family transcriptional regulator [Streptomyces sp. NPDC086080]|uniref:TetR/AcrR family transcriptional regulator n=1 Tax=Streptomyces sp. NPDC086080 TaxID=3365748 RepID=UPI0037CF4258
MPEHPPATTTGATSPPVTGPAPLSLRQRRRAVATQEIVEAAERHLDEHGPAALSLRAVARSLGMTVQALYHYFPNRDALVTVLITRAYDDLADAVQTAVGTPSEGLTPADGRTPAPGEPVPPFVKACESYRAWAVTHPERFQLIYGTPLRDYTAPVEGPTTRAMRRMSAVFQQVFFSGFSQDQLAAADTHALPAPLRTHLDLLSDAEGPEPLPPAAAALLLSAWGHMHGLVVLEVFGHTTFLGGHQAEIFRMAMHHLLTDTHRRIPGPAPEPSAKRL